MTASLHRHLADAARAGASGDAAEARRQFAAALAIAPDHPVANNSLGLDALAANRPRQAADYFARAAAADPTAIPLWMNLAKAQRQLGDDAAERAALEQALDVDQTHLTALIRLAELHERRGEVALATDRWAAVESLSKAFSQPSPELTAIVSHATEFLRGQRAQLSAALDQSLAATLEGASERERRRFRAANDYMLGRRAIFANQCHGYHYPFLPADEYFDREHFGWLPDLEAATEVIREELLAILAAPEAGLAPYVTMAPGTPHNSWSSLDGSLDWSALHLWREGERIDAACARASRTAALLDTLPLALIPGRAPTVFFSILKAGAHIPAHTGVTNTRTIVHLPLVVPPGCEFRVGGETRAWHEGEALAFDDTIEHEAWNRSDRDRAVLILDVWNPHLSERERALIVKTFAVADALRGGQPKG